MNGYGISNIKIIGYTNEEIKKIDEAARDRQYNKHGYRVLRSNIDGPIKQPKFNLKIVKI